MTVDISVLIGGEAGQGIQTVGLLMAHTCHRAGLYVMAVNTNTVDKNDKEKYA